jgi:hypothetical protein
MTAELGGAADRATGHTLPLAARSLLRLRRVDVVHAHMTAAELAAVLTRPTLRAPLVATCHFAQLRGASRAGRLAARVIAPRLAAQLAISGLVRDRVEGPSVVVRTGVADVGGLHPHNERRPVVLVAQRLEREKRTDVALHVWATSGLADRGWRLEVAGSGARLPTCGRLRASSVSATRRGFSAPPTRSASCSAPPLCCSRIGRMSRTAYPSWRLWRLVFPSSRPRAAAPQPTISSARVGPRETVFGADAHQRWCTGIAWTDCLSGA